MTYLEKMLPGVEIRIYQGSTGWWFSSVLLDHTWPRDWDALPHRGNRPLVDSGSGRWWYDLSVHETVYRHKHATKRTPEEMVEQIDLEVAVLLAELVGPRADLHKILRKVQKLEHRVHAEFRSAA